MNKIHWFGDMGYRHNPWTHCPTDVLSYENGRCLCPRANNFDDDVPCTPAPNRSDDVELVLSSQVEKGRREIKFEHMRKRGICNIMNIHARLFLKIRGVDTGMYSSVT